MALFGGGAIPLHSLVHVRIHAPAVFIADGKVVLRRRIALFRGNAVPEHSLLVILLHTVSVCIGPALIIDLRQIHAIQIVCRSKSTAADHHRSQQQGKKSLHHDDASPKENV